MTTFWLRSDYFLTLIWLHSVYILTKFWLHFDYILKTFWPYSDYFLTTLWLHSDYLLTIFWLPSDYILTGGGWSSRTIYCSRWSLILKDLLTTNDCWCLGLYSSQLALLRGEKLLQITDVIKILSQCKMNVMTSFLRGVLTLLFKGGFKGSMNN